MKKDFETLYSEIKLDSQERLLQIRHKIKKKKQIAIITMIGVVILGKLLGAKYYFLGPIIFCSILGIGILKKNQIAEEMAEYKLVFKETIANNLLSNFFNELNYVPRKQMPQSIYDEARFIYYQYSSDDYAEGKIDNIYKIKMAEVKTIEDVNWSKEYRYKKISGDICKNKNRQIYKKQYNY